MKPNMPLLFTCLGGHWKCYIRWAIIPWFKGSGMGLLNGYSVIRHESFPDFSGFFRAWKIPKSGKIVQSFHILIKILWKLYHDHKFQDFGGKLTLVPVWYNRNTAWLRDTVRQTSRGKSAAAGRTTGPPRPLTSRGTSAWPYRVTTQYSFYPAQIYS